MALSRRNNRFEGDDRNRTGATDRSSVNHRKLPLCRQKGTPLMTSDIRLVEAEPPRNDSPNQTIPAHKSPAWVDNLEVMYSDLIGRRMTDRPFWCALRVLRRRPR